MASDSPPNSLSPNKRLKTSLIPDSTSTIRTETDSREPQEKEEEEEEVCGICMRDDRRAIRGQLDCCDHFFCFVCILLWAKVESRCPTCKRRFTTIRRPPKHDVFPSERLVHVPKRDQVYYLFGNTTIAHVDPCAEARCSVCKGTDDDSLLLLCDLCDCAFHTFCVGLGATVPEGDWFCLDCAVSRTEHENLQLDCEGNNSLRVNVECESVPIVEPCSSTINADANAHNLENSDVAAAAESDVSISDIVHEPYDPSFNCPQLLLFRPQGRLSTLAYEVNRLGERYSQTNARQTSTRTLRRCHNVNSYIRALRENWDALRSGSLRFSSSPVESSSKCCRTHNSIAAVYGSSNQPHSSSSITNDHQLTTQVGGLGFIRQDRPSYDIQKAWRMMDRAKSMQKARRTTTSFHQASKYPFGKGNALKEATDRSLNLRLTKSKEIGTRKLENTTLEKRHGYRDYSLGKETEKHVSWNLEKKAQDKVVTKEIMESNDSLSIGYSPVHSASVSSWKVQSSSQGHSWQENGARILQKDRPRDSLNNTNGQNSSAFMITLVGLPGVSDSQNTKPELGASSSCKVDTVEAKASSRKRCSESKARKDDDAKSKI